MIVIDVLIILLIGNAAYWGRRRGLLLVSLELVSIITATVTAVLAYVPLGRLIHLTGLSLPRSRVIGFLAVWFVIEIGFAVLTRYALLPRLQRLTNPGQVRDILAGAINGLKVAALLAVAIIAFSDLPIQHGTRSLVTEARIPRAILEVGSGVADAWDAGPGRDLTESLSTFVISNDPESRQRIDLTFKTTDIRPDPTDEAAMLVLVNRERTSRGLGALTLNVGARGVARAYSTRMLREGYFSHLDNDGHNPFDRLSAGGVGFGAAGENLALAPNLQRAHNGLMNSPGHRRNILSPRYRTVGIGIIDAGPYGIMVSQEFTD